MASSKKQEKPSTIREQTNPVPGDQPVSSSAGGDIVSPDIPAGDASTATPKADTGASATQQALPEDMPALAPTTSTAGLATQLSPAGNAPSDVNDPLVHITTEVSPTKVEVYPLRSFMDEGELRRRGGPSYVVTRLHAEDLERRNLVSRSPMGE